MPTEILQSTKLFDLLYRIDTDLSAQQQKACCPFCGGSLHYSTYRRKPRGGPTLPEKYSIRLSLCCNREKCSRRTLPKSTLFMDRRVYFRVVILIVTTLSQNKAQKYSKNMLSKMIGANRKTINSWKHYFRELFPKSRAWKVMRGFISPLVTDSRLPASLVEYYLKTSNCVWQGVISCLVLQATELGPGNMIER